MSDRIGNEWRWALLMGVALVGCNADTSEEPVAGYAYTQAEDGELVLADGTRAEDSTKPGKRIPKGSDADWLSEFDLIERSGDSVTSEQLKGQPYVASFFFSMCGSICQQQNAKVQLLQEKFSKQPVRFVSISCDPEIDRPDVLQEYAKKFDADEEQWLFMTGELDYIRRVGAEMFQLPVMRRFHAEKFVLVDAKGNLVGFYTWTDPEQWLALQRDVEKILAVGGTMPDDAEG